MEARVKHALARTSGIRSGATPRRGNEAMVFPPGCAIGQRSERVRSHGLPEQASGTASGPGPRYPR